MRVSFLVACLLLTGCATASPAPVPAPEGVFKTTSLEDVQARITKLCMSRNYTIVETTPNRVVCEHEIAKDDPFKAATIQILIGNSYSTSPIGRIRFTMFKDGADVRVTAYQWLETQMVGGQVQQVAVDSQDTHDRTMAALRSVGME